MNEIIPGITTSVLVFLCSVIMQGKKRENKKEEI